MGDGETEEIDENNLQIIHTKFPKIGVKNIEYSDSNEDWPAERDKLIKRMTTDTIQKHC